MPFHRLSCLLLVTSLSLAVPAVSASADPPSRVARVSFTSGSVSFRPASIDEWSAASLNYPLTLGDHVWTGNGSRTELQLGTAVVRLAPNTELSVLNLDDASVQLRLTEGSLSVRVRRLESDDAIEIDTPVGAVSLVQPGLYRIDVTETGDASAVTVRRGRAEVATDTGPAVTVGEGQSTRLSGLDAPRADLQAAVAIDQFEDWCLARDRREETAQAGRYVSSDLIGYEDLDTYGAWQVAPEYGPVWVPRVSAEWVPYHFGHWVWVEPWGWTWVDDAPWGFAPFHYGRWTRLSTGWGWVPGTVVARPVYAPALVAFVGGAGWNVSVGVGSQPVAWFPLGPREVFVPAYRAGPTYVQRINIAHVTNVTVTNVRYVNQTVPGAVTAVPRDAFVRARPVSAVAVAVSREQIRAAAVIGTSAPLAPQRASIIVESSQRAAAPPREVANRQVLVRRTPPALPAMFSAKQAALEQHPGQAVEERESTNPSVHPLVRAIAPPRREPSASAAGRQAPAASAPPAPAPATAAPARRDVPPPAPYVPQRPSAPAAAALARDVAVRHAREQAEIDQRHTAERAQLQARHLQEMQRANARERADLRQRHADENKALQQRQLQERSDLIKRHEDERKQQQHEGHGAR
jgi:hypothetical protein